MCGIVGFTGNRQAAPILLDGLSKLEYRGYDSAGLAVRARPMHIRTFPAIAAVPAPVQWNRKWSVCIMALSKTIPS